MYGLHVRISFIVLLRLIKVSHLYICILSELQNTIDLQQ